MPYIIAFHVMYWLSSSDAARLSAKGKGFAELLASLFTGCLRMIIHIQV